MEPIEFFLGEPEEKPGRQGRGASTAFVGLRGR